MTAPAGSALEQVRSGSRTLPTGIDRLRRRDWPPLETSETAREQGPFVQADGGTRTPDPFITSEVLYQLSYVGADRRVAKRG